MGFAGAAHESRQIRQAKRPQARRQRSVCGAMACRLSCAAASLPRVTIISLCERASAARHLGGLCRVDRAVPGARIGPEGRSLREYRYRALCTARLERRGATCRRSRFRPAPILRILTRLFGLYRPIGNYRARRPQRIKNQRPSHARYAVRYNRPIDTDICGEMFSPYHVLNITV